MRPTIQHLSLELNRIGVQQVVQCKCYDTARELRICLTENGSVYRPGREDSAVLMAKKPDGQVLFNTAWVENGEIHYAFTANTANCPGRVDCELRLYGGAGRLISAPRFELLVDEPVYHDSELTESASEFTALTQALDRLRQIFGTELTPVSYAPQSLTLEQAAQARENIMAPGKQEFDVLERVVDQLDLHFLSLDPQELTEEQQLQLRANIDAVSSEALARLLEAVNESFGELDEQVIRNTAQTLTPEQMAQARKNIGAQGVAQVQDAVNDAITDAMSNAVQIVPQKLTEAEKAQARGNLGAISAQEVAELVPVDATLKNAGQAADAAAVGRALGGLRFEVDPADGGLVIHYGEEEDDGND